MGTVLSFKDMKVGNTIWNAKFVGWDNYVEVFQEPEMLNLIKNTLEISIMRLFWGFWPPILLAICIFDILTPWYKKFCQTMVYIPYFFSWVIVYGIVFAFFSGNGLINNIMKDLGMGTYDFLTSKEAFRPLLIGSQVWKGVGWGHHPLLRGADQRQPGPLRRGQGGRRGPATQNHGYHPADHDANYYFPVDYVAGQYS